MARSATRRAAGSQEHDAAPVPTIHDVAIRAGVGAGTVSRVLNRHPKVSDAVRARVTQAIHDLKYTPNPHARQFAGGRSYSIATVLPVVATDFYLRLLTGLEDTCHAAHYDTALFPLLSQERLARLLTPGSLVGQADGLVMVTYDLTEMFDPSATQIRQPVVLANAFTPKLDCAYVDNHLGGRLAGEHAVTRPGELYAIWVATDLDALFSTRVFKDRRAGFHDVVTAAGRSIRHEMFTRYDSLAIHQAVCALLDDAVFPCTVFAAADQIAAVMLDEAGRRALRVGEDLRIIGFDDHPWSAERGLTTVHQPVGQMGAEAGRLLLSRLNGYSGPPREARLAPHLVVRATA
ncbi:LacI family DNA-binding transcriptional regulator [Deinococcus metalli]|nr:LacI family DNA-binding transcriptional regulator [Deinococcus metalli]